MRSLTIQREKTVVASMDTMKVYAEDRNEPERTLNGVPCRLIGELKNGEEKTFLIGEEETRVFVLSVMLPPALLNEFYRVPAGSEPVRLSGKCIFNPAAGNQFRFNDNRDEAVLRNRKQSNTRHIILIACAVALVAALILGAMELMKPKDAAPKEFSEQGMHITLTDDFSKTEGNCSVALVGDAFPRSGCVPGHVVRKPSLHRGAVSRQAGKNRPYGASLRLPRRRERLNKYNGG